MRYPIVAAALGAFLFTSLPAQAQVVTPNANSSTEGSTASAAIFGPTVLGTTFQTAIAGSQFSSIPLGSQITGIGFRLDGAETTQANALNYTTFQLQIGQSANPLGSLSDTFADNLGADTILAIDGLSIPAGSFVDAVGINPNPFYVLNFSTPYTYNGGDLLVTVREDGVAAGFNIDAVAAGGVTNTVGTVLGPSASDDQPFAINFFNAPVMEFVFASTAPLPELSTWVMMLVGFGAIGVSMRYRRRTIAVV